MGFLELFEIGFFTALWNWSNPFLTVLVYAFIVMGAFTKHNTDPTNANQRPASDSFPTFLKQNELDYCAHYNKAIHQNGQEWV